MSNANREIVFGFHSIEALLETRPKAIIEVVYARNRKDQRLESLLEKLAANNVKITPTDKEKIDQFTGDVANQGVMAMIKTLEPFGEGKIAEILNEKPQALFLVLDGITDPHNLGACMRSAEAAGVDAVIIPKDKSASLTSAARKISSGASEVLPLIRVTNLARTLRFLQENYVWVIGTAGEAEKNIYEYEFPVKNSGIALVMGNEGTGLRRLTREHCDDLVKIPMAGVVSSLNVSVATGVCLFEIVRQKLK